MKVKLDEGAYMPERAHEHDAGLDLRAMEGCVIYPNCSATIHTGVHFDIHPGMVGYVRGRSGMAFKKDVIAFEGTIDAGYTGEVGVTLYNLGGSKYVVNAGDKVAQIVFQEVLPVYLTLVDTLEDTERGKNGFGSTGK